MEYRNLNKKDNILIIDGFNNFIRAYIANPTLTTNGEAVGGTVGFLRILQKYCNELNPSRIFICWDGVGGSIRRKSLFSEYKANRDPARLNRFTESTSENEEERNKIWQMTRLLQYLENFPVTQLNCEYVEADDLVAWLCMNMTDENTHAYVISNDKDFVQLVNENVTVYRPTSEEKLTTDEVMRIYGIHPNNFCLAKAICGDTSDNVPGIKGAGFKTLVKRLPQFALPDKLRLDTLLELCETASTARKAPKVFQDILNGSDIVERNLELLCLLDTDLSDNAKRKILYDIDNGLPYFNRISLFGMFNEDGISGIKWDGLFSWSQNMIARSRKK